MSIYKSEPKDGFSVDYEIVEHIAVLTEHETGWRKELNIVAWNGGAPKYDIRDWSPDYSQMGRGVALEKGAMDRLVLGYIKHNLEV